MEISTVPFSAKDDLTFTFTSSDTSVATIKTTASNKVGCTVKAVGPGNATITVTDSNGITAEAKVTVTGSSTVDPSGDEYADVKDEIIKLTNDVRAENGVAALTKSDLLMKIAQQRAEESADNETIRHIRPDGSFYDTIFAEYGLDINSMQYIEILGYGRTESATKMMTAWKESSGHFGAMTAANKSLVGVGVAKGDNGYYYFCQVFTDMD